MCTEREADREERKEKEGRSRESGTVDAKRCRKRREHDLEEQKRASRNKRGEKRVG